MEVASSAAIPLKFKIGDRVRVDLDIDVLKAMQDGHGGWHPKMADVCIHTMIFYQELYTYSSCMDFVVTSDCCIISVTVFYSAPQCKSAMQALQSL